MPYLSRMVCLIALSAAPLAGFQAPATGNEQDGPPLRILLTNDDGIAEVPSRLMPVAQKLRQFAEVYIVVSDQDRSGTTQMMRVTRDRSIESRLEHVEPGDDELHRLEVHVVADGYPADCVALGALGILADTPPDLVISGPNGGPNLADAWFGSGTIGAARTGAYLGIPSVAVSGLDDGEPEQVEAAARWVADLARADAVRDLPHLVYLTVALPTVPPDQVAGIRVASRARLVDAMEFERLTTLDEESDEATTIWTARFGAPAQLPSGEQDIVFYGANYIVITPMIASEEDDELLASWTDRVGDLPAWSPR